MTNPHEAAARARKVAAILAVVPCGANAAEIATIADWLAALPPSDRAALAAKAKQNPPSATTWTDVVAQARARVAASDVVPF